VVLHEMLHGTLWIQGRAEFNESLATFIGLQGAALYFLAVTGGKPGAAQKVFAAAERRRQGADKFRAYLKPFLDELTALYKSPITREEKLTQREALFARARAEFLRQFPQRPGRPPPNFFNEEGGGLNNAVFVSYAVYHRSTDDHQRIFDRVGRDLGRFIAVYKEAVERSDPFEFLRSHFPVKQKPQVRASTK
jgi:predicted aminopeptidase